MAKIDFAAPFRFPYGEWGGKIYFSHGTNHSRGVIWHFLILVVIKWFYFACSKDTDALDPLWIQSSGSQFCFVCPGLVSLKLLANAIKWHPPSGKCTSEVTRLKPTRLHGLTSAFWGATKKLRAKVITSILVKKSVNSTIELRKQGRKILCRIRQGSTWKGHTTEVQFKILLVCFAFLMKKRSYL